jgi:hypothetical protein
MLDLTINTNLKGYNMPYREDELEDAIDRYVEALDLEGLVNYVTADMAEAYFNADSSTVDEFISQMNGE